MDKWTFEEMEKLNLYIADLHLRLQECEKKLGLYTEEVKK